jgi:hypothetical protein
MYTMNLGPSEPYTCRSMLHYRVAKPLQGLPQFFGLGGHGFLDAGAGSGSERMAI